MARFLRQPFFLLIVAFGALWAAAHIGLTFRKKHHGLTDEDTQDFTFIVGATLTLLGLIIGFTFSMAVSRYDQRKNFEEEEANAIGTEYVRADFFPAAGAARGAREGWPYYIPPPDPLFFFYHNHGRNKKKKKAPPPRGLEGGRGGAAA